MVFLERKKRRLKMLLILLLVGYLVMQIFDMVFTVSFPTSLPLLAVKTWNLGQRPDSGMGHKNDLRNDDVPLDNKVCKLKKQSTVLRKVTSDLFANKSVPECHTKEHWEICKLLQGYVVRCSLPEKCEEGFTLGVFNASVAAITWIKFSSFVQLEEGIRHLMKDDNIKKHYGYCFIKCKLKSQFVKEAETISPDDAYFEMNYDAIYNETEMDHSQFLIQLLVLPPNVVSAQSEPVKGGKKPPNINIIMVDSVSYEHFHRMLPKLANKLRQFEHIPVFSFKFVQAINHRTYENLEGLFSGYVHLSEKPHGTYDLPYRPLPIGKLLKDFSLAGYRTLWLEDLCWMWEWGLAKDLLVHDPYLDSKIRWRKFNAALQEAFIDDVDITFASCEILKANGKRDPFHDLPAVCFNGMYHHEYMFRYLELYQRTMYHLNQPYVAIYSTNVGHEETGLRIKTLESSLDNYLNFAIKDKNAVTILFSDHGNTYGDFISMATEAQDEIYHPFLFIIVPKAVIKIIDMEDYHNLIRNQDRLVSLLDVYYFLTHLLTVSRSITGEVPDMTNSNSIEDDFAKKYVLETGLFDFIPSTRTCKDVPMFNSSVCICEKGDVSILLSFETILLADFAVGTLNNQIIASHAEESSYNSQNCQMMILDEITDARKMFTEGSNILYKINFKVSSLDRTIHGESFSVTLKQSDQMQSEQPMQLISYQRTSVFASYQKCSDEKVDVRLCLCNDKKKTHASTPFQTLRDALVAGKPFRHRKSFAEVSNSKCLVVLVRTYDVGACFDVVSDCREAHNAQFDVSVVNMRRYSHMPLRITSYPGTSTFLTCVTRDQMNVPYMWSIHAKVL